MANSIATSEVIISSAIEVLDDLLAPLGNFSINVANEYAGRGTTVKVPLVNSADVARVYTATGSNAGYENTSDSAVSTVDIGVNEIIKPFHLSDNELYKSPVNLSNYIASNANAFGLFILNQVKSAIEAGTADVTKGAGSMDLATIKALVKKLDSSGVPVNDRHLVLGHVAHHKLLPDNQDVYGTNAQVMQSGRVGQLYGLQVHPTSVLETGAGAGKCTAFASGKNGIAIVNRLPETQGQETLQKYETFSIPGLGMNVAYREHFNTATGTLYGCFSTLFGAKIGDANALAWVKGA